MTRSLEAMTKEEVADVAAMLLCFQNLGAEEILRIAEEMPWLVERAPKHWEIEALLELARRGLTVATADEQFWADCKRLRDAYHTPIQEET